MVAAEPELNWCYYQRKKERTAHFSMAVIAPGRARAYTYGAASEAYMVRYGMTLIASLALSACGLAETAVTGASVAAAEVEAAKQAQAAQLDIQQKLDAAQQLAAEQRRAADAAGGN
jgi:F0F1-type ATP synthase epsilon subunit